MTAPVRVVSTSVPQGDEGTYAIVDAMRELADTRLAHPAIRAAAVDLAAKVPQHDITGQIAQVRRFLATRVRFLADPDGPELLHDPLLLLKSIQERGLAYGDCDDVATLGATLGRSIGIPARFVVVSFLTQDAPFSHVWAELFDGKNWRELDTTRPFRKMDDARIMRRAVIDSYTGDVTMLSAPRYARPPRRPFPVMVSRRPPTTTMGLLPAVPVVVAFAAKVGALQAAIAPFIKSKLDPDRFRITDLAYQQAIQGNDVALLFLKQRTGNFGVITIPTMGEVGGWGSAKAKAYAQKRYQEALARGAVEDDTTIPDEIKETVQEAAMPVGLLVGGALMAYLFMSKK